MTESLTPQNLHVHLTANQVIDAIGEPIAVVDATGQPVYFNSAWVELMGARDEASALARGTSLGSGSTHAIRPDGALVSDSDTAISRALAGEVIADSEIILTYPGNRRVWLNTSARPIVDENGSINGAVAISHDVTVMRMLQIQHEDERLRLQSIFDNSPVGITLFSAKDFSIIDHNAAGMAILSQEVQERGTYAGMRIRDLVDPESAEALEALLRHSVTTGETMVIPQFKAGFLDGTERYFQGTISPLSTTGEGVDQIMTSSIDVTEEVHAREEAQRLAEAAQSRANELETVINSMADAVIITDAESHAVLSNPAYDRLLGAPAPAEDSSERVGRFGLRHWDGTPVQEDEMPARRALRGEPDVMSDFIVTAADGRDLNMRISAAPLRNQTGKITGTVVVLRDVTALLEIDRQKDEFLSLVSHELRTPVTIIRGFAQVLGRSIDAGDAESTRRRLDIIKRQVDQLTGLINELLDLRRVQSGHFECDLAPLNYRDLVDTIVDEMKALHPERAFEVHGPDSAAVLGDAVRLRQVLVNLIDNGLKHGPPDTDITITLKKSDGAVSTFVSDSGPALPEEERERVFERFYRVSPRPIQHGGSLGLGLYISRSIVEAHRGRIWVSEDEHSSFAFSLPLQDAGSGPRIVTEHGAGGAP